MTTSAEIDPSTPEAEIAAFVAVIRRAFGDQVTEQHGPVGGYQWLWSRRGLWQITAGAVLHPEPVLAGPAGEWRIARADHTGAVYALLVLAGADALPPGVEVPGRSGMYAGTGATPAAAAATRASHWSPSAVNDPLGPAPGSDDPRPQYRQPGGNTGARPGRAFRTLYDGPPEAVAGPGAAYVPQQIPGGPAPAGGDLPARGVGLPDDTRDDPGGPYG